MLSVLSLSCIYYLNRIFQANKISTIVSRYSYSSLAAMWAQLQQRMSSAPSQQISRSYGANCVVLESAIEKVNARKENDKEEHK